MQTIKANKNVWGNWNGFVGSRKVGDIGASEWDAREWVSQKLAEGGYVLSEKSGITIEEVEQHRKDISNTHARQPLK